VTELPGSQLAIVPHLDAAAEAVARDYRAFVAAAPTRARRPPRSSSRASTAAYACNPGSGRCKRTCAT
jgi:hypothetical protein